MIVLRFADFDAVYKGFTQNWQPILQNRWGLFELPEPGERNNEMMAYEQVKNNEAIRTYIQRVDESL